MFTNTVLNSLALEFSKLAQDVQARRFAMGDVVVRMLAIAPMSEIVATLKRVVPESKTVLGYAITAKTLNELASMARTFREDGGLLHGIHRITREDIEALGLTPTEGATLAEQVQAGNVRIKTVAKASKAAKAGKTEPVAQLRTMLKNGTDAKPSEDSLEALLAKRETLRERKAKVEKELADIEALLQERKGSIPQAQARTAPVQETEVKHVGKPKARRPQAQAVSA